MARKRNHLLIIRRLPPELAERLEGTDPTIIDSMEVQHALLQKQTELLRDGAEYIPSLGELSDAHFGHQPTDSTPQPL